MARFTPAVPDEVLGQHVSHLVRRINLIKRMMAEGMTLEEIRGSFVGLKNQLWDVESGFSALLSELSRKAREHPRRREMEGELGRAQREVRQALRRIEKVGGRVATVRQQMVQVG
jgi:DNA-binding transcriptional MerR regulator